jgi:hypothetical protein
MDDQLINETNVKRTIVPSLAPPGASWTTASGWHVGVPNSAAATGNMIAIARGPKVEIGRLDGDQVTALVGHILPDQVRHLWWQGNQLIASTVSASWRCDLEQPREVSTVATRQQSWCRSARVGADEWTIDNWGRLVSSEVTSPLPVGAAVFQIVALPKPFMFGRQLWDLLASAMDGLWLVDTTHGRTTHLHHRPARALTGDQHIWALFSDELCLIGSSGVEEPGLRFESPLAARSGSPGLLIGTRERLWRFDSPSGEVVEDRGATDIVLHEGSVIAVREGLVRCDPGRPQVPKAHQWEGGEPCRLISNTQGTVTLTAPPLVVTLDSEVVVGQTWSAPFGPLAAVAVRDRVFICGGESGLFMAGPTGVNRVFDDILVALDLCAVPDGIVVATGAAVIRIDCDAEPYMSHNLDLPGVSTVAADGNLVLAQVEDVVEVLAAGDLARLVRLRAQVDPRRASLADRSILICGYDALEVIDLD